jgi:hypothetical protein
MKNIHIIITYWALTVLIIFSAGCSSIPLGGDEEELVPISSIGVLPTQIVTRELSDDAAIEKLETGADTLNALLTDYFQNYKDVSLISQSKLEGLSSANSGKPLYLAREAGQQLHYDAVLITSVERYQERDGSDYAIITPASVTFSLRLLAVESGQVIWSSDFDQEQQAFLENILKSRSTGSGFRWLTVEELTSAGLTKKLDSSPYLKRN